ncbi:MAG TPA: hypothetical protein DC009_10065 [Porphyromonadaceae bacterium]|nr:hypothetical protein [Porphyromonadaceae bacterium]
MKKSTIFSIIALCGSILSAGAELTAPQAVWGATFDSATTAGDQAQSNAISADDNVYWHLLGGTKHDIRDIYFGQNVLFQGADYDPNGTSQNNNLCIMKTDKQGNLLWKMNSTTCDFYNNQGDVVATSDGGVIFTAKLRNTDDGGSGEYLWNDVTLVDGKNQTHTYTWNHDDSDLRRFYQIMIGRLSADGDLLWVKFIQVDRFKDEATETFYSDAISVAATAVDDFDNVYIAGNFRANMTIPTSGRPVVLSLHDDSCWSADAQSAAGDMYIIKLNGNDGSYIASAQSILESGIPSSEKIDRLEWKDGCLYGQGLINGDGVKMNFGGKSFTLAGDFSPILFSMNADLTANWVTPLKGEKIGGKMGFQYCGITKVGNTLWFTGMFDGIISAGEGKSFTSTAATPSVREGFICKFDAATGAWVKGVTSRESYPTTLGQGYSALCGYFKAVQNEQHTDKVYVFGYAMNGTVGVFMRTYDAETLASDPATEWNLVKGGQMPTCQTIAYDPTDATIYITARGRNTASSAPFELLGDLTVNAPSDTWAILMAGYNMPEDFKETGVVETVGADNTLRVYGSHGQLVIENAGEARAVRVYDIAGRNVATVNAQEGKTTVELAGGIYIVEGRKVRI